MLRVLVAVLVLGAGSVSAEPTPEPTSTPRPVPTPPPVPTLLEPEMAKMRNMIRNATTKVRANVVGISGNNARPAQVCCSMNIEAIQAGAVALDGQLDRLSACYLEESDSQMRANVEFARSDLAGIRRALVDFTSAEDRQRAVLGADGLSRTYLLFLESASKLRECPSPPASGSKGGGKKKGKDKQPKGS